jgi:hypothetical protein
MTGKTIPEQYWIDLKPYAVTESQQNCIDALIQCGTYQVAAEHLGIRERTLYATIKRVKRLAAKVGHAPEHDMIHTAPDGYKVKGTSTLYGDDGQPKIQWVKTSIDEQRQMEMMHEAINTLCEDLPAIQPPKLNNPSQNTDVIPWFIIGDAHLGALALGNETGIENNLEITERELLVAMTTLIHEAPATQRCVIYDVGDFTHYQDFKGESESGHKFDIDQRYPDMIKAYIRIMLTMVNTALEKFENVDVIINQGNHSRSNDIFMRNALDTMFKDSGRVTVLDNASVFIPYRMGNTFVMCHHGDKSKHHNLPGIMATDYAHDWGEATYRYIWTGHIHHKEAVAKEQAGVMVESWNSLTRGDKYHHEGGWRSRKCMSMVEVSKTYGRIGTKEIPIERVVDIVKKAEAGATAKASRRKVYTV